MPFRQAADKELGGLSYKVSRQRYTTYLYY